MNILRIILYPLNLVKIVITMFLVVAFWMLESILLIIHYVIDEPLKWVLKKLEQLIRLLIKQIK